MLVNLRGLPCLRFRCFQSILSLFGKARDWLFYVAYWRMSTLYRCISHDLDRSIVHVWRPLHDKQDLRYVFINNASMHFFCTDNGAFLFVLYCRCVIIVWPCPREVNKTWELTPLPIRTYQKSLNNHRFYENKTKNNRWS